MSALSYPSMSNPELAEAPAIPPGPALLDYAASHKAPPPPGPAGTLGYYPWGDQPAPFVDPGSDPIAVKHELLKMLGDEEGAALIKETIDRDPSYAPVWLERCGLADHPQLKQMVSLSLMYPSMRKGP